MKNAGFGGIRDYVAYVQCFETGEWNEPTRYNGWVDVIKRNNLSQIIQLDMGGNLSFPKTEADINNFANYAAALVSNLSEDGVMYYELFNERNWSVSAEEYANVLIKAVPAMKKAGGDKVKILAFATTGVSNYHSASWIVNVINILKDKGLEPHDYIDYISVHPYKPLNQYPERSSRTCSCTYGTEAYEAGNKYDTTETIPGDSSLTARMDNLTNRLTQIGCQDIPIIATEIGWYSYEGNDSGQTDCETCIKKGRTALGETGQAQYSVRAATLLYNKLERIYFHTLNNKPSGSSNWERNFGFTENWNPGETEIPYEAKPVYIAMAAFNAMTGNSELKEENKDGTKYDYVFQKDGKRIHMMWTTDTAAAKTVTVENKAIVIYDMYGNRISKLYNNNGTYSITLTQAPVYVEEVSAAAELSIENTSGNAVGKIGVSTRLCAVMNTAAETEADGLLICAAYKDNVLTAVETAAVGSGEKTAKTPYVSTSNADTVRAFYWKTADNTPCCEAASIER